METYEFHQYCNLLPDMPETEFAELTADIQSNGLINPIILYENQILVLDGKHRCQSPRPQGRGLSREA